MIGCEHPARGLPSSDWASQRATREARRYPQRSTFYAAITEAIADAAGRHGYAVALCVSHDDTALDRARLEMLAEHRVAGVLLVPGVATGTQLRQLRMVGARLVLVDRVVDDEAGCSVVMDDIAGGRLATEQLLRSSPKGTLSW
ncbi:substrate-binding domain-containing protein [Microbacterium deminutum]|uniref:Periplasmic binding protein/LacI sugar binding domain-containing protein n=1 Tax=Microbacterium deminutum TaxID=344164 RepID=A0ABP5CHN8_9MICO